jgi:hypothetical protein
MSIEKADKSAKNPFFDERDSRFLKLTSKYFFFELFTKKKNKCNQLIPETILFNNGNKFLQICAGVFYTFTC